MSASRIVSGSPIINIDGNLIFEWRAVCDGWVVEQQYALLYQLENGLDSKTSTFLSAWEKKDGSDYKFFVDRKNNKAGNSSVEGQASLVPGRLFGLAEFNKPQKDSFDLPKDTLFPSGHTFFLLKAAHEKKRLVSSQVFDGVEFEGASFVSSAIGRQKLLDKRFDGLESDRYFPIRMAYFPSEKNLAEPEYEITLNLHENGVVSGLLLDYSDVGIKVELLRLELIDEPSC